ncbi:MAG: Ldh family oxidoreductase [Alphaproteobacteria bacterium]
MSSDVAVRERRLSAELVAGQIDAVMRTWDMPDEARADAVEIMVETDLRGIDSHGISMLPIYGRGRADGFLNMTARPTVVRDRPAMAVLDNGGGLGYHAGKRAMAMAVDKAKQIGIGAVAVRNSNHFGAAGAYALRAAEAGCIGIVTTNALNRALVPTRSKQKLFGTNPIAFAAPARDERPFVLDMATTTVAVGKLKLKWLAGLPMPAGWVVDGDGQPETDATRAFGAEQRVADDIGLTPLGGLAETSSHKGYGLSAMVEILSATLSGATFIATRFASGQQTTDIGHFFMAIDPAAFREPGEFEADMDEMIRTLRGLTPVDPAEPVLVPGDPEAISVADRKRNGVPIPDKLWAQVRDLCADCGAPFIWNE